MAVRPASAGDTAPLLVGLDIHPSLTDAYPQLRDNPAQMRAVAHSDGPLLIIAGPVDDDPAPYP